MPTTYAGDMQLADKHGRVATDLRVSLTDRCNLRCQYCMPAEGLDWMPTEQTLTDDELVRLIGIAVERLGVADVRFTGGEPLLRRGLPAIIAATKALRPSPRTAITSNGLGLERTAQAPDSTASTSASTPPTPRRSPASPVATVSATSSPASRPHRPPASTP
jgi:cyclic pyranopterin phosphate synthase